MVLSVDPGARPEAAPKIRVVEATKVYETRAARVPALDRFSVDVRPGEFLCFLGPSGCGKTTLLWAMAGLHALTSGQILLDAEPVRGPRPREIGLIFQEANLLPWRNLLQNIVFPFEIKRTTVDWTRIRSLLDA
ncbi:MAG: sulfonate ABC transporter ATP-binding protein, partial [Acidobacteria bacterium]